MLRKAMPIWTLVLTATVMLGLPTGAWASHRWGCWKYADATINWYHGAPATTSTSTTRRLRRTPMPGTRSRTSYSTRCLSQRVGVAGVLAG